MKHVADIPEARWYKFMLYMYNMVYKITVETVRGSKRF
jgi:hypothetical protein